MKKLFATLIVVVLALTSVFALVACDNTQLEGTAAIVAKASKMSEAELMEASRKEMADSDTPFKVVGLTSVLAKTLTAFQEKYDWITKDNSNCKNDYKDYALLQALESADKSYFADYALVQDVRSIATYDGELLHNYVPADYKELGLSEADTVPLKGIYFNKLFWTNSNFENVTGKKLYNIWQLAGWDAFTAEVNKEKVDIAVDHKDHISNVSFQSATTEQINKSFLISCEAPENQARIEKAYKEYYGKDWAADNTKDRGDGGTTYASAGEQWVTEFLANISRFHTSDGTAMKETQLKEDWTAGYVYYGAFAKMKDAVGKYYTVAGQADDPILKNLIETSGDNAGKINAMKTVKWDWEIEGFNGFMYAMCSQVVNNAKHPYTACLYARFLCTLQAYEGAIYNSSLPAADGTTGTTKVNQYGYYAPASNNITYAQGDWNRDTHIQKELVENYNFLKTVKLSQGQRIDVLIGSNKKAK